MVTVRPDPARPDPVRRGVTHRPSRNAATPRFVLGVDLGQVSDFTALCVAERTAMADEPPSYEVRHIDRAPLGTSYPAVVTHVGRLMASTLVLDFIRKGQLEDALEASRDYLARAPDFFWAHAHMAWTLGLMGRTDEARNYAENLRRLYPEFEPNARAEVEHWFLDPEMVVQLVKGLRLAGFDIPEKPVSLE